MSERESGNGSEERGGSSQDDGRAIEESSEVTGRALLRRLAEAVGEDSRPELRSRREESEIERYFEESLITCALPSRFPDIHGSEHEVWKVGAHVLKATMPGEYGRLWGPRRFATPAEYIQRIEICREVFDIDWRLVGIVREGRLARMVTTMPFYAGERPKRKEIARVLEKCRFKFFEHRQGNFWYREEDNVLLYDAEPGNFVKTSEGPIPIDLILQHPDEETLKIAGLGEV